MTNTQRIRQATVLLESVVADLEEKISMIDAEETHGAEWADQGEAFDEAKEKLEEMLASLDHVEGLV
jgi:hypothetical protein